MAQDITAPIGASAGLENVERIALSGADGAELPAWLLRFDANRFTPGAFAAVGLAYPGSIASSVRKRQAEFFFGRLAARLALSGIEPDVAATDIPIGASREPQWPTGLIGSITHCHGFAAAAAEVRGPRRGIGIDIEHVVDGKTQQALLATVVDAREQDYLGSLPDLPLPVLLTIVFSAKEAFFKGAFAAVGKVFEFDAIRVVAIEPERGRLRFMLAQTLCESFAQGQCHDIGFDFVAPETVLTHYIW